MKIQSDPHGDMGRLGRNDLAAYWNAVVSIDNE